MADTTLSGVLLKGVAASRPAASAVAKGTIYSATDTGAISQSDASSWSTYATISSGLADPMTTRGDVIVRNASNTTARLGIGSTGKVLSSDGTDISWQTPASSGALVLLEQHTASTSATLDFTTAISATYDEYQIEFVNVIPASNNVALYMRMSTNGGSSYDTSSIYDFTAGYAYSGGVGVGAAATNSDRVTLIDAVGNSSNYGVRGSLRLFSPGSTALYKSVLGQVMRDDASALGIVLITGVGGVYKSATAVNAFRFLFSSGNIASGTIRVYGIAK